MLALTGTARLWEPRRLRFRLFSAAAQLVTTGRRRYLRLAKQWPWDNVITDAPGPAPRSPEPRLTSTFPPANSNPQSEPWNPAPTRRDRRAVGMPTIRHRTRNGLPTPSADRHERSRLKARQIDHRCATFQTTRLTR